jgi:hypothetical protein
MFYALVTRRCLDRVSAGGTLPLLVVDSVRLEESG